MAKILSNVSPHRAEADDHLLQMTHRLVISISNNPTSKDLNYPFNPPGLSFLVRWDFVLFLAGEKSGIGLGSCVKHS